METEEMENEGGKRTNCYRIRTGSSGCSRRPFRDRYNLFQSVA